MSSAARKRAQHVQQWARRHTKKLLTKININNTEDTAGSNNPNPVDYFSEEEDNLTQSTIFSPPETTQLNFHDIIDSDDDNELDCSVTATKWEDYSSIWKAIDEAEGKSYLSSEDDTDDSEDTGVTFRNALVEWVNECSVPLTTVTKLLTVLRKHTNFDLPAQATTLLQTPRSVAVSKKSGGDYTYFGVAKSINKVLSSTSMDSISVVELCFNIDGLPIYKSTNLSLWPIQCRITNLPVSGLFIVALFSGAQKPSSLDFLEDFTRELKELMTSGLTVGDGKMIPVQIKSFICDAPARALIKGTVAFNSRHGCDFCEVCGKFDGRMMFLY
ncbi:uncharacterized protein [Paramormyrops kingsleyae]|uniref:uncharacterized protein isoform X4 n=1 Tax=Paramormyrops kingsleyae TaxID=1676925 RepID=UPI003B96B8BE